MFKLPYVRVDGVDAYFSLPKNEREKYGLYRVPYGLPCDFFDDGAKGWDAFYKEIKKHYPIQYLLRHWLWSFDNPLYSFYNRWIKWPIRDFYYGSKRFIDPCYPRWRKTLKRHEYGDACHLIVESNFNLLLDFWEEEVKLGFIDWNSDEHHRKFYKELEKNIEWIKNGRQKLQIKIDEELTNASKNKKEKNYHKKYAKFNKLEKEMFDKVSSILTWIINNRGSIWT